MKSHEYEFSLPDVVQLTAPLLLVVALFAGLMHLGAWVHLFPKPRPTQDLDHTILIHQAEAARGKNPADLVLFGDSSCLMDVSAKSLGEQLGRKALNLGLFSYLDLKADASMLRTYTKANPGSPRTLILLMHPKALRLARPDTRYTGFLENALQGAIPARLGQPANQFNSLVGVEIFKSRLLSRWLPAPLPGTYGTRYGFTADLEKYLAQNQGSLIDPDSQPFQGNAEYRLDKQLERASRQFKAAVPAGAKLFVAITPVPASFPGTNYVAVHAQMLKDWSQWLQAESLPLPATLPDRLFVNITHLNDRGVQVYTELLARALKRSE